MHETGVCRSIVETVEQYALATHAGRVVKVNLVLGEVHDVVPDILADAFEWMSRGTVVEGAVLHIERVPFTVRCDACGRVYRLDFRDESTWPCPSCSSRSYRLHTGREFTIASIEVEGCMPGESETVRQSGKSPAFPCGPTSRSARAAADLAVSGRRPSQ